MSLFGKKPSKNPYRVREAGVKPSVWNPAYGAKNKSEAKKVRKELEYEDREHGIKNSRYVVERNPNFKKSALKRVS